MTRREVVERARSFVGCAFRPQGRDPTIGLDCIGLVVAVFQIEPRQVRRNYRLGGPHGGELETELSRFFQRVTAPQAADILLCEIAPTQTHLAVHCGRSFVHAHAGIRRVVETPGEPGWPITAFRHLQLIQD
jgi:hypothetical protein